MVEKFKPSKSGRRKAPVFLAAVLVGVFTVTCMTTSVNAVTTAQVTIGISYVAALDPLDIGSAADMYWSVTVYSQAGGKKIGTWTSMTYNDMDVVDLRTSPWKTSTMTLLAGNGQVYRFVFDLNDKDLTNSDHLDTNGNRTVRGDAVIYFNIDTKQIIPPSDDGYDGDLTPLGSVNGGEDGTEIPWGSDTDDDDGYFEYFILFGK